MQSGEDNKINLNNPVSDDNTTNKLESAIQSANLIAMATIDSIDRGNMLAMGYWRGSRMFNIFKIIGFILWGVFLAIGLSTTCDMTKCAIIAGIGSAILFIRFIVPYVFKFKDYPRLITISPKYPSPPIKGKYYFEPTRQIKNVNIEDREYILWNSLNVYLQFFDGGYKQRYQGVDLSESDVVKMFTQYFKVLSDKDKIKVKRSDGSPFKLTDLTKIPGTLEEYKADKSNSEAKEQQRLDEEYRQRLTEYNHSVKRVDELYALELVKYKAEIDRIHGKAAELQDLENEVYNKKIYDYYKSEEKRSKLLLRFNIVIYVLALLYTISGFWLGCGRNNFCSVINLTIIIEVPFITTLYLVSRVRIKITAGRKDIVSDQTLVHSTSSNEIINKYEKVLQIGSMHVSSEIKLVKMGSIGTYKPILKIMDI